MKFSYLAVSNLKGYFKDTHSRPRINLIHKGSSRGRKKKIDSSEHSNQNCTASNISINFRDSRWALRWLLSQDLERLNRNNAIGYLDTKSLDMLVSIPPFPSGHGIGSGASKRNDRDLDHEKERGKSWKLNKAMHGSDKVAEKGPRKLGYLKIDFRSAIHHLIQKFQISSGIHVGPLYWFRSDEFTDSTSLWLIELIHFPPNVWKDGHSCHKQ